MHAESLKNDRNVGSNTMLERPAFPRVNVRILEATVLGWTCFIFIFFRHMIPYAYLIYHIRHIPGLELRDFDDGTGRQRWRITGFEGRSALGWRIGSAGESGDPGVGMAKQVEVGFCWGVISGDGNHLSFVSLVRGFMVSEKKTQRCMGIEWILKRFRLESSEPANLHEARDLLEDFHKVSGQELTSRLSKQ